MGILVSMSSACILVVFCMAMVSGCASQVKKQEVMGPGEKYFFVDILPPKDAFELIQKNKGNSNFVIVDVRTRKSSRTAILKGL